MNKQVGEGFHLKQQPQQVHLSSWQDDQEQEQQITGLKERYPREEVLKEP